MACGTHVRFLSTTVPVVLREMTTSCGENGEQILQGIMEWVVMRARAAIGRRRVSGS